MVSAFSRVLFLPVLAMAVCLPCTAQLMPPAPPFPDPHAPPSQTPQAAKPASATTHRADDDRDPLGLQEALGLNEKKEPKMAEAPEFPVLTPEVLEGPSRGELSASPLEADGERAIAYLLKHVVLNPNALVPGFGEHLTNHGIWSVGRQRPAACPKDSSPCVQVGYRTRDAVVNCQWVVLVKPGGGAILEQNKDATHYMLRNIPTAEAAPYIVSRHAAPVGRQALRSPGTVEVGVVVSATGDAMQVNPMNGTSVLRTAAYDLARQWVFQPMRVGSEAVPYQINLKFHFDGPEVKAEP